MTTRGHDYAVVLAAGLSQRMGKDKAALPWLKSQSLLNWTVEVLVQNGWQPVVVLGNHNYAQVSEHPSVARLVWNSRSSEGKTTSLAAGIQALPPQVDSILITSIDQPRPPALLRRLREETGNCPQPILACDRNGRNGHPIVCKGVLRKQLSVLSESQLGLRGFLSEHQGMIHRVPCDPDWLRWDFNTPEAYAEALEWFRTNIN